MAQEPFFDICEKLMEDSLYLEDNLNDHALFYLTPEHFMKTVQEISQYLVTHPL